MPRKPTISRPTAVTLAFQAALENQGIDTTGVKVPLKTQAAWSVTRRKKR